jgi:hypothetical protein
MFAAAAAIGPVNPTFIALVVGLTVAALERFTTVLDRFKKKSTVDAAAELAIANITIERLRHERNQAREEKLALETVRFVEPVLTQLQANAELQKDVLDRLVHHNGSFAHMEASMKELVESLKLLTGFIAGVVELPRRDTT